MKFKQLFKKDFILTQKEVNDIKYNTIGKYNKLDFIELCNKIELEEDKKLEINTTDIKYNININNKLIERKEKIVIFTTLKMRELLNNSEIYNYFMDVTYKIIPKAQKPYKLMTITEVNNKNNTTNLCALIGIIYEDYLSFYYTLKYLNNFYNFEPKIIHIDFSLSERKALNMDSLFKRPPIIISCFFHFSQSIFKKMKDYKIINKKLSKHAFCILRNIELICFINPDLLKKYENFLESFLKTNEEIKLFKYIKKNWLDKDHKIFNYYQLIKNEKDINQDIINHFYITNNIAESFHSKMNYYLPKRKITSNDFLKSIKSILNFNEIKNNKIVRKDFITRTLIKLASNIKSEKNFIWISYDLFKKEQRKIISINTNIFNFNAVDNIINEINEIYENNPVADSNNIENNSNNDIDSKNVEINNNDDIESESEFINNIKLEKKIPLILKMILKKIVY